MKLSENPRAVDAGVRELTEGRRLSKTERANANRCITRLLTAIEPFIPDPGPNETGKYPAGHPYIRLQDLQAKYEERLLGDRREEILDHLSTQYDRETAARLLTAGKFLQEAKEADGPKGN